MAVSVPTPSQLRDVASEVGLDLTDTDVTSFIELRGQQIPTSRKSMPASRLSTRYWLT